MNEMIKSADVVLVEGNRRIRTAIKYLTQSSWSHAAIYVGKCGGVDAEGRVPAFVEADMERGVRAFPIEELEGLHLRICRPEGLTPQNARQVVSYVLGRLGDKYDLKNVFDLARYLLPTPPVPTSWRRRMLALGSSDPTRAICSTLIAEAFETIGFPILPIIASNAAAALGCPIAYEKSSRRCHVWMTPADQGLCLALRGSWVRSCLRPLARSIGSAGPDVNR